MENRHFTLEEILGLMAYKAEYNGNMTCKLPGSILGNIGGFIDLSPEVLGRHMKIME